MNEFLEVLLDALLDSLKIFPFILLIYVIMEIIESAKQKEKIEKALSGAYAPFAAGLLGVIPECGFSVMCAKLFDKGLVKVGTLIAAFLAVSDEGLIIMISEAVPITDILLFVGVKVVYAIIVGEIINAIFGKKREHVCPDTDDCIECGEHHEKKWDKFLFHPLKHSLKILAYVFILNVIFGTLIYLVGDDALTEFIHKSKYLQPMFASLIGLIPNCASSVILSKAYVGGLLSFAGVTAGLSSNAGIGLLILFRNRKRTGRNLIIVGALFVSATLLGYMLLLAGL